MTKKKKKDPNAEDVKKGVKPKRGPRGSQSAEMNWLSARMERSHPSSSQSRLKKALGARSYERLSSRPNDPSPVEAARKRRENASTDYSKLKFLGNFLAEYKIRKRKESKGQGKLPFPEPTPKRRKKTAVPRRRKEDKDSKGREIDQPTETRSKGFKPETGGTRAEDVPGHVKRTAASAKKTEELTKKGERKGGGARRLAKGYGAYRFLKSIAPRVRKRRMGPNVRTGGTEGTVKL